MVRDRDTAEILRFAQDDKVVWSDDDVVWLGDNVDWLGDNLVFAGRFDCRAILVLVVDNLLWKEILARGFGFLLFGHLREAGFDDFFEEWGGEGFVGGEAHRTFGDFKFGEFGLKFVEDEAAHREKAAMVFEGGNGADAAVVFEGGDAIADGFDGGFGAGGADRGAHGLECGFGGFGEASEIVGDGFCVGVRRGFGGAFCGDAGLRRFFHGSNSFGCGCEL